MFDWFSLKVLLFVDLRKLLESLNGSSNIFFVKFLSACEYFSLKDAVNLHESFDIVSIRGSYIV